MLHHHSNDGRVCMRSRRSANAVCDVVADQPHAFNAVDAPLSGFVGVPSLGPCAGHWVDAGFASEGDHDVDVTNELRINECGCVCGGCGSAKDVLAECLLSRVLLVGLSASARLVSRYRFFSSRNEFLRH